MSAQPTTDDVRWHLLNEFGVPHRQLRALYERLGVDYTVADYGYAQLWELNDIRLRAVVSDQILRTAQGIADNLLAACLHRERLDELVGSGRALPKGDATATMRANVELDMALSGAFGSLASALDCLAGVAIGVCRLPRSLTRADISHLEPLGQRAHATGTAVQQQVWTDLAALFAQHREQPPEGWFAWLMDMRNLMTHRARQQHTFLQQTRTSDEPQLVVITDTMTDVTDRWRFELHLRTQPGLPDMQDFTRPGTPDLWMGEPATTTVAGLPMLTGELVDAIAQKLHAVWDQAETAPGDFPPPAEKWQLAPEPGPTFNGLTGVVTEFRRGGGLAHPQLLKRLELAEKVLRDTRAGGR